MPILIEYSYDRKEMIENKQEFTNFVLKMLLVPNFYSYAYHSCLEYLLAEKNVEKKTHHKINKYNFLASQEVIFIDFLVRFFWTFFFYQ